MRIPDACRLTGISRSTLYLLIARGEVEVVKMGAATLVLTESLRQLIERHRCSSPSLEPQLTRAASARPGQTMRAIGD
ncbi:MAG: helix-turn-helix domain-containing protein [Blastomonas fulva]|uniref:helix-turn-helix domain-containing protein n=1 Tax=Alphaproteobacteria TaxID=28211 RepID=UPI004033E8F9